MKSRSKITAPPWPGMSMPDRTAPSFLAIRAHQDAIKSRDEARHPDKQVDASFLNDLAGELEKAKGELRSDQEIDAEVDATQPSVNKLMTEHDLASTDEVLMQEFRSA